MFADQLWAGTANQIPTHQELVAARSRLLEADFASGKYEPFVWPYCLYGLYVVLIYLLLPPNTSKLYYYARYPLYLFNVYWCVQSTLVCRSRNPPVQYAIGLINSFACLWLSVHIIWRDTRTFSKIIVWKHQKADARGNDGEQFEISGKDAREYTEGRSTARGESRPTQRAHTIANGAQLQAQDIKGEPGKIAQTLSTRAEYYWESLPTRFSARFAWICSVVLALRGEGTSHGIQQLPSLPPQVRSSLKRNSPSVAEPLWIRDARTPLRAFSSKSGMIRHYVITWAITYVLLDISKQLIARDPYFTGFADIRDPLPLPQSLVSALPAQLQFLPSHPVFAKSARLSLCCAAILSLLTNATALPVLLFSGVLGLRDQPWMYPTMFGSTYVSTLTEAGIAGWWGRWWHQLFRLSFDAPVETICHVMKIPGGPRSKTGRTLGMFVAFGLSAAIHAAGSFTLNGESRPWAGSGLFFLLQSVGILIEQWTRLAAHKAGLAKMTPPWAKTLIAMVWVHTWMYHTAPLMGDDVAKGGVWTTEVVPVSFVDGLMGGTWIRWEWWMMPTWHSDEKWWKSGIAF